jgi:hypothetical protein
MLLGNWQRFSRKFELTALVVDDTDARFET